MKFAPVAVPETEVTLLPNLPERLEGGIQVGPYSQVRDGELLRVVPDMARFHVVGAGLRLAIEPGADEEGVDALLQGPVTAALIYQRGEMPLHGATLVPPGGGDAVALVGGKGAGKSTLSYALQRRGWTSLNDDLSRIGPVDGAMIVKPGRTAIRLCEDACERFHVPTEGLARLEGPPVKYRLPETPPASPRPLGMVLELTRADPDGGILGLSGMEAVALLLHNTYRPAYLHPMGVARAQFALAARLAAHCRIGRLTRAAAPDALAEYLTTHCSRAEDRREAP